MPRNDPSDDESAEDLLEKMLKQAEELAQKMSRQSSGEVSVTTGTDAGSELTDPALVDVTNGSIKVDELSSDNDTELEELLKQSETLLGKMRAGGLSSTPQASVSSPLADKVEPPKVSPNAPTSVYLLENCGTSDDVSSVGSNSLRSPIVSPSLRMPTYSTSTDPIQEEPLMPAPNPLSKIPSITNLTRTDFPLEESAAAAPIPMATKIPDFTVTPPDAKWEKVASASQGDEDYVPLVDYSKLSPNTAATSDSSRVEQPYLGEEEEDDGYLGGSAAATTSRVAAFRAQKKRLQKKRRRQMAALALGITLVGGYCMYTRRSEETTSNKEIEIGADTTTDDLEGHEMDSTYCEGIVEGDFLDNHTLSDVAQLLLDNSLEGVLDILDVEDVASDDEEHVEDDGSPLEGLMQGDDAKNSTVMDSSMEVQLEANDQLDSHRLANKCKNPFQKIFNRMCRELECQTDSCLEKRCKNIIQRIFNRKCRVLTRQKKGKKEFQGINLQAVAGI